ncbi:MAG: fused MFS/spermidine synthase, partial [Proteobacteria bacterium]|nr:fused MFS/spermidine synthase [Pseudomonadota bacterium]MBU1712106.1 fused MFS/spermidine synthase [Pseudomonadota bacterium]
SMYQYIQVREKEGTKVLSVNEGMGTQSVYDPENILTNKYYDYLSISPYLSNKVVNNGLIIGLAGGTLSRQLNHFFPGMQLTGVEIDPGVIKAAKEHFNLDDQRVNIIAADGRMFVKYSEKEKYDLIFIDAYSQELYIPWHLTTREFFSEISGRLNDDGLIAMNIVSNSQESSLMKGIIGSLQTIYDHVYVTTLNNKTSNVVLASSTEIDLGKLKNINNPEYSQIANYVSENIRKVDKTYKNDIFTDNKAPVELLSDKMWMKEIINF